MKVIRKNTGGGFRTLWLDNTFNGDSIKVADAPGPIRSGHAIYYEDTQKFYIIGPYNGAAYEDRMYSYDPKTGVWDVVSEATLSGRAGAGYHLVKVGDWLYWGLGFATDGILHRYNPKTDTFEANYLAGVAAGRGSTCAFDPGSNTLYSFGELIGTTRESTTSKIVDLGGPGEQVVNGLPIYPNATHPYDGAAVYFDGYCYVKAGGTANNNNTQNPTFKRFNTETDTWEALQDLPRSVLGGFMWIFKNDIYFKTQDAAMNIYLFRYKIATDTWTEVDRNSMPTESRLSNFAVADNGRQLWCFGGYDDNIPGAIANTQLLVLNKTEGVIHAQRSGRTTETPYRGTFYRDFRIRVTQTNQIGTVQRDIVSKLAPIVNGIQVTENAQVDVRQVQFHFYRVVDFQLPAGMNVRALWRQDGDIQEFRDYMFLEGCENGLNVLEDFRPAGFTSFMVDMSLHNVIAAGYEYDFTNSGAICGDPNNGYIDLTISIPREHIINVDTTTPGLVFEL